MTGLIKKVIIILCALFLMSLPVLVKAEIKIIETESSYIMGDNDSKIDARRIATQEAKRKALEMAGTFMESLTEVKNMALAKDEIKAYTAGVVETDIISEDMKGTSAHPEIFIRARCKIDTAVLIGHINSFRKNEDIKEQLNGALKENESLKKERDNLTSKLSAEKDKSKAEDIRKKLGNVLAKEEANDEIKKLWGSLVHKLLNSTDVKRDVHEMSDKDADEAALALKKVLKVNPENQRAHMLLAAIYRKKGNNAGAEKEIRAAIALNPSNPFFHFTLGLLLKNEGRYTEALKEFKSVEQLKPNKPDVLFHIGIIYKAEGNCQEAVPNLEKFLIVAKRDEGHFARMKPEAIRAIKECRSGTKQKPFEKKPLKYR
ncbi:MAG: tetratricopeptide repeat protein [Nitrospirae bacterium]|nr:tetratricopeptide repeat protein [Nitrospirota bacterium]